MVLFQKGFVMLNLSSGAIALTKFCKETGFEQEDILAELNNRGIALLRIGNNYYLTKEMVKSLFSQDTEDNFVTNQPICSTALDNRPSAELLSQPNGKEVLSLAKATISFVSKEGRKKPFMVQWGTRSADGGEKRKSKCFATRAEAETFAEEINNELERANFPSQYIRTSKDIDRYMCFYDYMLYYIEGSGQCTCSDRTKKCYMDTAERIHRELDKIGKGFVTLHELDDIVLNTVIKNIASCSGSSLVNKVYGFIKRVLSYAFARGYINRDIAPLIVKTKCRKMSKTDSNRKPYTYEEIRMLLDAAKPNTRLYTMIVLALYSGMRPAEIRALRWTDIDLSNGEIHVNGAVKREYNDLSKSGYTEHVGSTKSDYGIRDIPLADSTAEALTDWRAESENSPIGAASEFIFYSADGSAMNENQFNSLWRRFISSHGWKGKGYFLYRFRHTFCTRLLLSGRTPQEVQALMGDSTLAVIMNIYNGIKSRDVLERSRDSVNNIFAIE